MNHLPWEWVQSFVAVARSGSLSKGAQHLNSSQPTMSRHVAALESRLGITLFDRSTQGLHLTEAGAKLMESSQSMAQAADQFSRIASGATHTLHGSIRISANEIIGLYYLPEILVAFNQQYPEVKVEVVISNQTTSINRRDADIALRMYRPTQPDLIVKRLADINLAIVASRDYLNAHPLPHALEDMTQHKLIGFDQELHFLKSLNALEIPLTDKDFSFSTDFLPMQVELARSGAGITITHQYLVDRFPELQTILPTVKLPPLTFWLVCHADVQHNRRIRVMMDFLAKNFSGLHAS